MSAAALSVAAAAAPAGGGWHWRLSAAADAVELVDPAGAVAAQVAQWREAGTRTIAHWSAELLARAQQAPRLLPPARTYPQACAAAERALGLPPLPRLQLQENRR